MKCIVIDDDKLVRIQLKKYIERTKECELMGTFESADEAVESIMLDDVDLIFLDIEMPGMSGIDFLDTFKHLPAVVIISGKERYAVEAFDFDVDDYILKPIEYQRFLKAINKVKAKYEKYKPSYLETNGIFLKENATTFRKILYEDIFWIEALENYVSIHTTRGRYTIHFTMKALERLLPNRIFFRLHRSYIVNLQKIEAIEDNTVVMYYRGQKKAIPIAKAAKDELLKRLNIIKN